MRPELEAKLFEKYPAIFKDRLLSPEQSPMFFGICCGDGWYRVIDIMCEALQRETDSGAIFQVLAEQVKEKYGMLRFYYDIQTSMDVSSERVAAIEGIIRMAEVLASRTCEKCGADAPDGTEGSDGWISVQCPNCRAKGKEQTGNTDTSVSADG